MLEHRAFPQLEERVNVIFQQDGGPIYLAGMNQLSISA
jgi:hypothetical protein